MDKTLKKLALLLKIQIALLIGIFTLILLLLGDYLEEINKRKRNNKK